MSQSNGLSAGAIIGIGAGVGAVGWLVLREKEKAGAVELREQRVSEMKNTLESCLDGYKTDEKKVPVATALYSNLLHAESIGIGKKELIIIQTKEVLERSLQKELSLTISKTAKASPGYQDGDRLRRSIELAEACQQLYRTIPVHHYVIYFWSSSCGFPLVGVDKMLMNDARELLSELTSTSYRDLGHKKIMSLAATYWPGYVIALAMSSVQISYDAQLFAMLPSVADTARTEGLAATQSEIKKIAATIITARLLSICSETLTERSLSSFTTFLYNELYVSCLKQDLSYYDANHVSEERLGSLIEGIKYSLFDGPMDIGKSFIRLAVCFSQIYKASPRLFLPAFAPVPIAIIFFGASMAFLGGPDDNPKPLGLLQNILTIRTHVMERHEAKRHTVVAEEMNRKGLRQSFLTKCAGNFLTSVVCAQALAVYYYSCKLMIEKKVIKSAELQSLSISAVTLMAMLPEVLGGLYQSLSMWEPIRRAAQIINAKPTIEPSTLLDDVESSTEAFSAYGGDIRLENVTFEYPLGHAEVQHDDNQNSTETKTVLNNVSLTLQQGKHTAIVGPIGCGKSTIIRLLLRLYDPTIGDIIISDTNIKSLDAHALRRSIAVVSQDSVLLGATIKEAVCYGFVPLPPDDDVIQACQDSSIYDFVKTLPDGIHSRLGGINGVKLSGGQRQCFVIARALLRKPSFLLLDEATSSLDPISEKLVQQSLDEVMSKTGQTIVTVAHRLHTVMNCDSIIVINSGKVAEVGTHSELLEIETSHSDDDVVLTGFYRKLWESQCRGDSSSDEKRRILLERENTALRQELQAAKRELQTHQQRPQGGALSMVFGS